MALDLNRKIDAYRSTTNTTATTGNGLVAADLDTLTATPLETAEGSDELRFAVLAGAAIAGGIGLWWWMKSKKKRNGKKRRKARGYLL